VLGLLNADGFEPDGKSETFVVDIETDFGLCERDVGDGSMQATVDRLHPTTQS